MYININYNLQRAVFQLYPGREHVQRHIKNDSEMKDEHGKMGTDF